MQKIVFNAHYLMYLDTAMGAYWRELALPYADTMASLEGDLFVKKPPWSTTLRRCMTNCCKWGFGWSPSAIVHCVIQVRCFTTARYSSALS